ncbi:thiol reductant ABC exporter subunit CydC [Paraoerskovia sediminicola]|uniref:Thiol reductant ABC exporter subunit CydC n=1 Tax=Paraoerskovia sediminicola TaxID=1138587 RepID=A0ABN6XE45_9CELL|nr:thiol reductant ABC exporter subunit CydC [Paraoerskovia sediminicola]BDZ43114.1 thiol reductant ABC exporter subunit CydC [Paraoerskovia sediminicola]
MSAVGTRVRDRLAADPLWRATRLLEIPRGRAVVSVLWGALSLGSSVGLAAVAAWLIARASQMPDVGAVSIAVVAVRAFGIGRGVARYLERLASHDLALRGMTALRTNLYELLARGRGEALARVRRGDLLARVGADVDAVGDVVVRAFIPSGVAVVVSLLSVGIVGVFLPAAGLVLAACLVLAGVVSPWLASRASRATEARSAQVRAEMSARTLEVLEHAGPLQVAGALDGRTAALRSTDRDLAAATDAGARVSATAAALQSLAIGLAVLGSLLLGIPAVAAGTLAPVELSVIVLVPLAAFEGASALPAAAIQVRRSRESARRIMEILDEAGAPDRAAPGPGPGEPADDRMTATGLAAGWGERPCVVGVDLAVPRGGTVAVLGPSGVGKTTLLATLAGLLPALGGRCSHPGDAALVAEDGHVFETSVLENLRVARGDLTEAEAMVALERVGLAPWVDGLPDGVATPLGPDGATVSGGERRRLLVARALVSSAPWLLVDEPAEHLEAATADELLQTLVDEARASHRGLVVATHRLSGLGALDEVVVLGQDEQQGTTTDAAAVPHGPRPATVTVRGTHDELLRTDPDHAWALAQETLGPTVPQAGPAAR